MLNGEVSAQRQQRPYTVAVEGNIGAGKSTFLDLFRDDDDEDRADLLYERVDKWRNACGKGHNLLGRLYKDAPRWNYLFQSYTQLCVVKQLEEATRKPLRILERSLLSYGEPYFPFMR